MPKSTAARVDTAAAMRPRDVHPMSALPERVGDEDLYLMSEIVAVFALER